MSRRPIDIGRARDTHNNAGQSSINTPDFSVWISNHQTQKQLQAIVQETTYTMKFSIAALALAITGAAAQEPEPLVRPHHGTLTSTE